MIRLGLRILAPLDRFSQQWYRRAVRLLLVRSGVRVRGLPLWISPDTHWDAPRLGLIEVGDRCVISHGVRILTHDFSLDRVDERLNGIGAEELCRREPVRVGAQSFIGMGSILLPGVTIGDGAIVGAGSVVTKDVPSDSVVAGNPARPLGSTQALLERRHTSFQKQPRRR